MRRVTLVLSIIFLATGLVVPTSFSNVSEAREATADPPPSGDETGAETTDLYFQVVDNDAKGRFRAPGWETRPADSETYGEDYVTAEPSADAASYRVTIPEDDFYSVYARWPMTETTSSAVRFSVPTPSGMKSDRVDQSVDDGFWVRIGAYEMQKGERILQVRGDSGSEGRVVADAVMVIRDVLVGHDGRTASYANPDELAPDDSDGSVAVGDALPTRSHHDGSAKRADVLRTAKRHLGTPYGHSRCRNGVREDCSCHTRLVFKHFGRTLPDSPVKQWRMRAGVKILRKVNLRRGDLVFHDLNRDSRLNDHYRDHVSIWAGNGNIIHASSYFGKVVISEEKYLNGFWGGKRFRGVLR